MTQAELELVAREIRARGLHSSWDELLTFSEGVVGSLVDVYKTLLKGTAERDKISPSNTDDVQKVVREKLATVLNLLTSEAQVAKWESEVLAGNSILNIQEIENSGLEGN